MLVIFPVKVIDSIHLRMCVITPVKVINSLFLPSDTYRFYSLVSRRSPFFAYVIALQTFVLAVFISMAFSVFQLVKIGVLNI